LAAGPDTRESEAPEARGAIIENGELSEKG